jgi:hypothetical protein
VTLSTDIVESARHAQEFDAGVNKFITGLFEVLMER